MRKGFWKQLSYEDKFDRKYKSSFGLITIRGGENIRGEIGEQPEES